MISTLLGLAQSAPGAHHATGEADLTLPDLKSETVRFLGGLSGHQILSSGLLVCLIGIAFGVLIFSQLRAMPVHKSMLEISSSSTRPARRTWCHAGQVHLILELFIAAIIA
jgi:K(+)-stimulated pyrophosphate-energized sodium pump